MEMIPRKNVSLNADLFPPLLLLSLPFIVYTFNFDSVNFNSTCAFPETVVASEEKKKQSTNKLITLRTFGENVEDIC